MARLYDHELKSAVQVADERVEELIASGEYAFLKGDTITLIGDENELYDFPAENAYAALRAGYRYAPIDLVEREDLKEEVEDSPWTSAGLGALRTLSFGLSDKGLQYAGFTPEEIRMHRELNPIATTAGEVGGLIFPLEERPWLPGEQLGRLGRLLMQSRNHHKAIKHLGPWRLRSILGSSKGRSEVQPRAQSSGFLMQCLRRSSTTRNEGLNSQNILLPVPVSAHLLEAWSVPYRVL